VAATVLIKPAGPEWAVLNAAREIIAICSEGEAWSLAAENPDLDIAEVVYEHKNA